MGDEESPPSGASDDEGGASAEFLRAVAGFGATLYEIVTGTKPFGAARSLADILLAHRTTAIAPVRRVRLDLPARSPR